MSKLFDESLAMDRMIVEMIDKVKADPKAKTDINRALEGGSIQCRLVEAREAFRHIRLILDRPKGINPTASITEIEEAIHKRNYIDSSATGDNEGYM